MNRRSGFSYIELLISVLVIFIISLALFFILRAVFTTYQTGTETLNATRALGPAAAQLLEDLQNASRVTAVSLAGNTEGFIQYKSSQATYNLYLNTDGNKTLFGNNAFASRNMMLSATVGAISYAPEVILTDVDTFQVITYGLSPGSLRVVTPNNVGAAPTADEINSVRFVVTRKGKETTFGVSHLIDLVSTRLALSGSQEWGSTGTNAIPLAGNVTTSNVRITNESILGSDGVSLQPPVAKVRLKHTGLYYATIQSAIDTATSGDIVQVSGGTYSESITMKAGVTLLGGFNPDTWGRDLVSYPTQITTTGFSDTTIVMRTNTRIDGFTLDGRNLSVGIRIANATGTVVSNCRIIRNDIGILINNSSAAEIRNNAVTANVSSVQINGTAARVVLYRNRFESLRQNTTAANIQLVNAGNVDIRNNLIIDGEFGLEILSATVTVANNVITRVQGRAVLSGTQSRLTLHNNAIYNNNFGLFIPAPPITSIEYNYFGKNLTNGNAVFPGPIAAPTNIVDNSNLSPFDEETTFVPSAAANPSLIDAGNPATAYNDRYTGGPGLGTTRNDIGAYGGPEAGRIGPGQVTSVTPTNVNTISQSSLWPGDYLQFGSGQFSLGGTVSPRYAITIYGQGPEYTVVQNNGAQPAFSLDSQNELTDMALTQNVPAGNGVQIQGQNRVFIGGLLIKGFLQGIAADTSTVTANHISLINNTTGVRITNVASRVHLFGNLITGSITGILNSSAAAVSIANSVAYNPAGVNFSGNVSQSSVSIGDPQFWNSAQNNYFPSPTSNTIDIYANQDAGCFEFFFSQGFFTTATLTANVDRDYQTLTAYLGSVDAQAPTNSMLMTQVQAALIFVNLLTSTTVTLNPTVEVTQNTPHTYTWTLSPTAVANQLAIRMALKSYKFGRSPYLDRLILAW